MIDTPPTPLGEADLRRSDLATLDTLLSRSLNMLLTGDVTVVDLRLSADGHRIRVDTYHDGPGNG
jgi:hypothetical protein